MNTEPKLELFIDCVGDKSAQITPFNCSVGLTVNGMYCIGDENLTVEETSQIIKEIKEIDPTTVVNINFRIDTTPN